MEENEKPKISETKAEHTLFKDMEHVYESGDTKESERIFRIARENEVENQLQTKDKKVNRFFLVSGLILLCVAIIFTGYALTNTSKNTKTTGASNFVSKAPFRYDAVKIVDISDMRTFEKAALWNVTLTAAPKNKTLFVQLNPKPILPDVFAINSAALPLPGINNSYIGIRTDTEIVPFIVASINDIDMVSQAIQDNSAELSDGLALFFGYASLSATERANVTAEEIVYQNQPMVKISARHHTPVAKPVDSTEPVAEIEQAEKENPAQTSVNNNSTAESMLQALADSIDTAVAMPIDDESQAQANADTQLLFAYAIVRQKYLIIAPTEAQIITILGTLSI